MAETKNWHQTEQINEDTWRIIEGEIISCYLLLGSERALLIDTGNGMGSIGDVVAGITCLPVTVALTHRHCDHAGGRGWFSSPAYVHEADMCLTSRLFSTKFASRYISAKWTTARDFPRQPYNAGYTTMTDGSVFDLGGRTVRVMHAPGHTRGSVIFFDDRHRFMFVGDNLSHNNLWMHLPGAVSIEEWIPTATQILKLSEQYTIYSGHDVQPFDPELVTLQLDCARSLVEKYRKNGLLPFRKAHKTEDGKMQISYSPRNVRARR